MERFAVSQGYQAQDGVLVHASGRHIVKQRDAAFPWEEYEPSGELLCRYWAKDHCLERQPLELSSEVWNLLETEPDRSCILLTNLKGEPKVFTGMMVAELKHSGRLTLHPASYRVRLERAVAREASS